MMTQSNPSNEASSKAGKDCLSLSQQPTDDQLRQIQRSRGPSDTEPKKLLVNAPSPSGSHQVPFDQAAVEAEDYAQVQACIAKLWNQANVPKRHGETLILQQPRWYEAMVGISRRIGQGFLIGLFGPRGTGKTQLAVEVIRSACRQGRPSRHIDAAMFFVEVRTAYKPDGPTEQTVLNKYLAPTLLVIDAIEERGNTPAEDRLLATLINQRYGAATDTILISNEGRDEFLVGIGDSIASRMTETGAVIECNWPSFRRVARGERDG